jgi:hypothetical protein
VPDPLSIIRLAALLAFIGLVAVGLWLLDVAWWVVPPVMALALLIAWTIEWLAWRGTLTAAIVRETTAASPAVAPHAPPPPIAEEPQLPIEAIVPPEPVAATAQARQTQPEPPSAVQEPPEPEPAPPAPQPEPEAEPEPEPEPEPTSPPVAATPPEPEPEPALVSTKRSSPSQVPERRLRRPRRMRLRPVPPVPQPAPELPAQAAPGESSVVALPTRPSAPRSWNLWDLERIAREGVRSHPERRDEWAYLFLHLRQFASADGSLPTEFDGLVRESFGGLLERSGA